MKHLPAILPSNCPLDWINRRREEVRAMYEREIFGPLPPTPERLELSCLSSVEVFDGAARRFELLLTMGEAERSWPLHILMYLPLRVSGRVPALVGLNFADRYNAECTAEPDVSPLDCPNRGGKQAARWDFRGLVERGYAVLTSPRHDIFLDDKTTGYANSINALFDTGEKYRAISAWAFGCRMLFHAASTFEEIDRGRIYVHGHSRLGKTALWASANYPEFAGAVSNDSGCCGAALFRDKKGERIDVIGSVFPHWFVPDFAARFGGRDDELDFDQHFLLALSAPRPLLVASASEDEWADPANEFKALLAVETLYRHFGASAPRPHDFPALDTAHFGRNLGYYCRRGAHDVTSLDWQMVTDFFDGAHKR